ncbi:cyclin-dependent kinase 4 inhibitor C [Bufo bufo]|uniref:cyclin-dependent kinase 4 inhibitor C n=1 Tax=Bufo bufo TaxID=8384 RepID=UPI001ABE1B4A|nr:cyclin-dependent kinase 4 inhibitor C [Bufo bufo]XP_040263627.1 cyclin-dependent kinase 4 inhibitor C [Bufo bufo]
MAGHLVMEPVEGGWMEKVRKGDMSGWRRNLAAYGWRSRQKERERILQRKARARREGIGQMRGSACEEKGHLVMEPVEGDWVQKVRKGERSGCRRNPAGDPDRRKGRGYCRGGLEQGERGGCRNICSSRVPGGGPCFTSIYYDPPISSEPRLSACSCHALITLCPGPQPSMAEPLADLMSTAAARGDLEQLEDLLQRTTNVDAPNRFGRTALQVMRLGCPAIASLLLRRGADPNLQDRSGFSVLHDTARAGFLDTLQILLDFQADVNLKDHDGNIALHLAAMEGHLPMVQYLVLQTDTRVTQRNMNGDTPCDLARMYKREHVVLWLQSNARGQTGDGQ